MKKVLKKSLATLFIVSIVYYSFCYFYYQNVVHNSSRLKIASYKPVNVSAPKKAPPNMSVTYEPNNLTRLLKDPNNANVFLFQNTIEQTYTVVAFESSSWIFNKNVLQYSTIMTVNYKQRIEIESIIMFNKTREKMIKSLKCFFLIGENIIILQKATELVKIDAFSRNKYILFKVKCSLEPDKHVGLLDSLYVGVIDLNDLSSSDSIQNATIFVHKPKIFDRLIPKQKKIVNCVHTVYDLSEKRYLKIRNWIQMNKAFGVERIKLCALDFNSPYLMRLKSEFSSLIEINKYQLNLRFICSIMEIFGVVDCFESYFFYFNAAANFNFHEKICTNECKYI
jgi:hypothetical protein